MKRVEITHSEEETLRLGKDFAGTLNPGEVVCLKGALGAGKTRFVKGMATAFGINPDDVRSPTFSLIHEYEGSLPLYHFDCYRLKSPEEAVEIGAEEYFYGEGISVIEWPEKIHSLLPPTARWIVIETISPGERKFIFDNAKN